MAGHRKLRKNGKGSILLISCLLIGSAAIRIGSEAGKAVATESPLLANTTVDEQPPAPSGTNAMPVDISTLLEALQIREERVARLEQQIDVRRKALEVADEEVEKKLQALAEVEETVKSLLAIADTAAEDDIATLTAVYENMKPKDAAALFEEMEPDFAAGFLGRMRPDAAAGIMAGLSPKAAYTISVILAGRNANMPKG